MALNVNATRMNLLKLRERLEVAMRGHSMLKDKLDELTRQFLDLVEQNKGRRQEIEEKIIRALNNFIIAKGSTDSEILSQTVNYNEGEVSLEKGTKRIMNLLVPTFEVEQKGNIFSYGFLGTTMTLDAAYEILAEVLPEMVTLAQMEKSIQILAEEIEKTRRRVNALEYILIPDLEETVRDIRMKLEERERSTLTRLMKVKEMIQDQT